MRGALERYAQRRWYCGRRPGLLWRGLAGLYRLVLARRWQRPGGIPPCAVVVVGNLTVGGTGKTPVVAALAAALAAAGWKPAIVSRGYGGRGHGRPRCIGPDADPVEVGDEPAMLAALGGAPVWVCSQRRLALEEALAAGADVVIADDGLQHAALPRSFEILVIDGERGLGNGWLLPAGPLRSPPARLGQVDAVLLRGPVLRPDGPAGLPFKLEPTTLAELGGQGRCAPDSLSGQAVSAVCGIGNPDQFARQLEGLGMQVSLYPFPDHYRYRVDDLEALPRPIVTTAKDAVKLRRLEGVSAGIHVLEVRAVLPPELIARVLEHVREFAK